MEEQNSQGRRIIEISVDVPTGERCNGGSKLCGEAACGFSDAGSNSEDAKERSVSMLKPLMAVALCVVFMSVEVVGGINANSLAILTGAAFLLSDVASFAISLFSIWAGGWKATPRQSYGFFRVEILGALVSMQFIWLLAGILVYEAIVRLIHDTGEVNGFLMFLVATLCLVFNIIKAFLLGHDHGHGHGHDEHGHGMTISAHHHHHHHEEHPEDEHHHGHDDPAHHHGPGISHSHEMTISTHHHHHYDEHPEDEHQHGHEDPAHHHEDHTEPLLDKPENAPEQKKRNINVQAAYLHVLRGSIQSIGIMIGGAIIWYKPEWKIIDLICTLIFHVIVFGTTIKKLRNIIEVLMDSTPREIDATKLEKGLLEMEEVVAIHELHIWAIKVGKILLTCHAKIRPEANADMALDNVINYIRREYNISHVTIQIER